MLRKLSEVGLFKGKVKEAYMKKSPVGVSLYTMPMPEALDILNSMDMEQRPKLLAFLSKFTEDQIATNGWASMKYAELVIKGRFKKGEPAIRGNWGNLGGYAEVLWSRYKNFVLSLAPYNSYPGTAPQAMTEEGKALQYEFERMDNQIIRER